MNGELKDMEAFEAAMAESGYHAPKRSPHNDGYLFDRDQDRYIGFKLARPTPAPGALPELQAIPESLMVILQDAMNQYAHTGGCDIDAVVAAIRAYADDEEVKS